MTPTERILAGEDITAVLAEEEPSMLQRVSSTISNLSNFAFGRGALAKAAGGGSPSTSPPPTSGAGGGVVPGSGGKTMAQMAQDHADRVLKKPTTAAPSTPSATKPATRPASESMGLTKAMTDTRPDSASVPSLKPAANPLKGLTKHLRATPVGRGSLKTSEGLAQSLIRKVMEGNFDWQELDRLYGADFTPSGRLAQPFGPETPTGRRPSSPEIQNIPSKPNMAQQFNKIVAKRMQDKFNVGDLSSAHQPHAALLSGLGWKRDHTSPSPRFTHDDYPLHSVELHHVRGTGEGRWMLLHHGNGPREHADLEQDGLSVETLGHALHSLRSSYYDE